MNKNQESIFNEIQKFVSFCLEVVPKDKQLQNFSRMIGLDKKGKVNRKNSMSIENKLNVIAAFKNFFVQINSFDSFEKRDVLSYKSGSIRLQFVRNKCLDKRDDIEDFTEYMKLFEAAFAEDRSIMDSLMSELNLSENSNEYKFMMNVFNKVGRTFVEDIEGVVSEKKEADMASLLPVVMNFINNGKFQEVMNDVSEMDISMGSIFIALGTLFKKYEDRQKSEDNDEILILDEENSD